MKALLKKGLALVLAAALWVTGIPVTALAEETAAAGPSDKLELKDDYISVTVSGENGGFLIFAKSGRNWNAFMRSFYRQDAKSTSCLRGNVRTRRGRTREKRDLFPNAVQAASETSGE